MVLHLQGELAALDVVSFDILFDAAGDLFKLLHDLPGVCEVRAEGVLPAHGLPGPVGFHRAVIYPPYRVVVVGA